MSSRANKRNVFNSTEEHNYIKRGMTLPLEFRRAHRKKHKRPSAIRRAARRALSRVLEP